MIDCRREQRTYFTLGFWMQREAIAVQMTFCGLGFCACITFNILAFVQHYTKWHPKISTLKGSICKFFLIWKPLLSQGLWVGERLSTSPAYLSLSLNLLVHVSSKLLLFLAVPASTKHSSSQPVGHNPLRVERSFHRGCQTPWSNTDIYIAIHNSSKVAVMK